MFLIIKEIFMDILRLAITLSDSSAKRFNKILSTLIINILYSHLEKEKSLSCSLIQKEIKNLYDLEFSTSEIESATNDTNLFISYRENNVTYLSLSPKAVQTVTSCQKSFFDIDACISLFVSENLNNLTTAGLADFNATKDLISRFIYNSFNEDKEILTKLISGSIDSVSIKKKNRFSQNESETIKLFLDWNNDDKNKFVFDVVRAAYDYCILTSKQNAEESMFSYKKLYLDTNVIFSLTGINGEDRMYSTKAFINKCRELHSEIVYTSETANECRNTLENLVNNMASLIKKENYLSYEDLKSIFPSSNPAALYLLYTDWIKGKPSRNGDYSGFFTYILEKLNDTLDSLKLVPIERKFIIDNDERITHLQSSIIKYKELLNRKHSSTSARVDACNYLYIDSIRNKSTSTITNQNIFFISMDSALCRWASEQCSGYINLFMSPGIMYSLMLRFSARTKDDYRSFNEFVSLRFASEYPSENVTKAKEEMIGIINELELPDNAKKTILHAANRELNRQIKENTGVIDDVLIHDVVDKEVDTFYEEFEQEKDKEKELAVSKAEKDGYQKGYNDSLETTATLNANKIILKHKIINVVIVASFILLTLSFAAWSIINFINDKGLKTKSDWILAIIALFGFVATIISFILKNKNKLLCIDFQKIYNKELAKLKKQTSINK